MKSIRIENDVALYNGDCLEVMDIFPSDHIDACITDPPYGLNFMGKDWDADVPSPEYWKEVYRILKPGAFLFCFAGTRTWHWMAVSIEKAGFEIKETIMWIHGQGFPKSYNIAKGMESKLISGNASNTQFKNLKGEREEGALGYQKLQADHDYRPADYTGRGAKFNLEPTTEEAKSWVGYGTALKPAWEPIIVAMKPNDGTYVNNALKWGNAGLNIADTKVGVEVLPEQVAGQAKIGTFIRHNMVTPEREGRYPANLILDEVSAKMLDEQTGGIEKGGFVRNRTDGARPFNNDGKDTGYETVDVIEEAPAGKSRFFYCAKATKKEKGEGNNHPTVKPLDLMRYLAKFVKYPNETVILDPFMGSGTTGMACVLEDLKFVGIEQDAEYFEIASNRIKEVFDV